MGDTNLSICHICKEPIWNFICPDCIATGIKDFLPSSLVADFKDFHKNFLFHFTNPDMKENRCLECKDESEFTVCAYCYTTEVHGWLEKLNKPLAGKFLKVFSFGFETTAHVSSEPIEGDHFSEDFGVCDECGDYTEELVASRGELMCRNCGEYFE